MIPKRWRQFFKPDKPNSYQGLYLASGAELLEKLTLRGIGPLAWSDLDDIDALPVGLRILQEGVEWVRESAGLLIWSKRSANDFGTTFVEVNLKMKALRVKEVEKRLDKNKVNWCWRWDHSGYRILLTYWNFVDVRKGEGLEIFIRHRG